MDHKKSSDEIRAIEDSPIQGKESNQTFSKTREPIIFDDSSQEIVESKDQKQPIETHSTSKTEPNSVM